MQQFSEAQLDAHEAMLHERVFDTELLPQFRLLLRDVRALARATAPGACVVSLERGLLYGGISLVAPFFQAQRFQSVDCSPPSADERGPYNAAKVDDPRCLRIKTTHRAPIDATGLESACADVVMVPNLVHHVADQRRLFAELARIARPGGLVYVFEPLVRELHQMPDDYLRYTPSGMERMLREVGLAPERRELEGGPFSTIGYCWTQALEYFPAAEREKMTRWFREEHWPQLVRWDEQYRDNLVRKHTSFPTSFSIWARKPRVAEAVQTR
jgi:SAM-dependent methyltransferase